MRTYPIDTPVNSQVTFSKKTNAMISAKARELGVTRSRLINTLCFSGLDSIPGDVPVGTVMAASKAKKPAVKKATKRK